MKSGLLYLTLNENKVTMNNNSDQSELQLRHLHRQGQSLLNRLSGSHLLVSSFYHLLIKTNFNFSANPNETRDFEVGLRIKFSAVYNKELEVEFYSIFLNFNKISHFFALSRRRRMRSCTAHVEFIMCPRPCVKNRRMKLVR